MNSNNKRYAGLFTASILLLALLLAVPDYGYSETGVEPFQPVQSTLRGESVQKSSIPIPYMVYASEDIGIVEGQYDEPSSIFDEIGDIPYAVLSQDELPNADILSGLRLLFIGSDTVFGPDAASGGYLNALTNAKSLVEDGGVVIATGKSSAFPAFIGGNSSPTFYNNFSAYHEPYGSALTKTLNINNVQFRERLGGAANVTLTSPLPVSQHSMIDTVGTSKILSTSTYIFRDLVVTQWGADYEITSETIPTAIEYAAGTNGGKVTYSNIELAPNYGGGGLPQMYVDTLLDLLFFKERDEVEIAEALGGDYYDDLTARPINTNQTNLNLAVYLGINGLSVNNTKANANVSFMFTISERRASTSAPQIDSSGDPALTVSLYKPNGELYATHSAISGDKTVSIGVPASDSSTGNWKFVVNDVHGFDGNRVVLVAAVDGLRDIFDDGSGGGGDPDQAWDIIVRARPSTTYPRGYVEDAFYHQLGDGKNTVKMGSVNKISFGGLVRPSDVKVWRIDDDLVLDIHGSPDRVTIPGWFSTSARGASTEALDVQFFDGTVLDAEAISSKAVVREPEVSIIVVSTDKYIFGTDSDDNLSGGDANNNFFGGPGDDTMSGGPKSNVYNYHAGWGDDTIIGRKNDGQYKILRFGKELASGDVTISHSGDDVKFWIANGSVTVKGWYSDERAKLDNVQFADGEVWDARDVEKLARGEQITAREQVIQTRDATEPNANEDSGSNSSDGGGCDTSSPLPIIGMAAIAFAVLSMAKARKGHRGIFTLLLALASIVTLLVLFTPAYAATSLIQQEYSNLTGYSDITNFTMDGGGNLYVVKDKSTASATLVRFDRFCAENGTFTLPQDIEEIAASPSGKYVYYRKNTTPFNAVYRIDTETGTSQQSASFSNGGSAITIEKMAVTGDDTLLVAWHTAYDTAADYPNWLPAEIKLGQFKFSSPKTEHEWIWNPDWETESNFDGDPSIGRLGDSWDYRVAFNLVTGITAYTEHYVKFNYEPTNRNHHSGYVTHIYRNDNTTGEMIQVTEPDYPDWDGTDFEPAYTSNGVLIYRSHPDYIGVSGDHHANFIDAVYTADQGTREAYANKYVSSWSEGGTTVNLSDMWETPYDAHLNISIQYLADYQGDIVITKHEQDADSGETQSLKLIKFTSAAAAGQAILGTSGADTLLSTPGNDYLFGDAGNDIYVWNTGDGNDIINDYSPGKLSGETGILQFADVTMTDVEIRHNGYDIVFYVIPTGEFVTIAGWYKNLESQLTGVQFSNGRGFYRQQVTIAPPKVRGSDGDDIIINVDLVNLEPGYEGEPAPDEIYPGDGNDIVYTGTGSNKIHCGPGNDYLIGGGAGGSGTDYYLWHRGDGNDLINDYSLGKITGSEVHSLEFEWIDGVEWVTSADVELETTGADLIFNVTPNGESVRVMNWFLGRAFQLDYVIFPYYNVWDTETINSSLSTILQGTDEFDSFNADASVKFINGEGDNDSISLTDGGHIITGGPGNDSIAFWNVSGDPSTLIWNLGDGFDDINGDYDQVIVAFGEGISPEDITIEDDPGGWVLSAPGGGMLFLQDSYGNGGELSQITFADGTVWNASDIEEMIQGNMSPFSMSMTQVARAFWASLPNESAAASSESSSGGGCDAGAAGTTGVLIAAAAAVIIRKSKKRG